MGFIESESGGGLGGFYLFLIGYAMWLGGFYLYLIEYAISNPTCK